MSEYKELYLKEAEELLQSLNSSLLEFEKNPTREDLIKEMARCAHTLKSNSSSMGFEKLAELSHSMEDGLLMLQESGIEASDEIIDLLFECFDYLEVSVDKVSTGEEEPDNTDLLKKLEVLKSTDIKKRSKEESGVKLAERPQTIRRLRSIKVDIKILDKLVDLVGELLTATMRFQNLNSTYKIKEFDKIINQLNMLTEDIQYEVTEARMIPVGQVFNRFPRMVRDLAKRENKKVDFTIEGSDIQLDRTVLDQIGEPLIHLLRNSIDHGIESPEERIKAGKPETGKIHLRASREKNAVIIEVIDDGAGFDEDKIKEIAIKKGVITEEEAKTIPKKQLLDIPFLPTFSTSDKVTKVSGRGVGLDVVKTKIDELNGSLKMETEKSKGTRFILGLPHTLAIIKCLLTYVGEERYALPIIDISRIVNIEESRMQHIEGNEVFILDGEDIPLIRLRDVFNLPRKKDRKLTVIITERTQEKNGIAVDGIIGEQELMIKSVTKTLKKIKGIAGATILGDGQPAMVLDINGLLA
ncbi:MAG: chemotaxis protein CheA [Candidatus Altiarchaeota archaeon]|nr:chemotaxis protein CheA [Candidatus Altiarchaeota archaeon]